VQPKTILVVGDCHVSDNQNLRRFDALGNFIAREEPDEVVLMGDFLSMDCLSEWDKNKRKLMENRRYQKEIAAGNVALDKLMAPCGHSPKWVYIKGNHENRLDRYLEYDPTFVGQVSVEKDLELEEAGWKVIEYKDSYNVDGISFTHIPIMGNGKPIGNPNITRKALSLYHNSVVFGHAHTLDHGAEHRQNAPHLNQALCAGCFFEHVDDYAVGSKTDYWRGVIMLNVYAKNRFDIETYSMSRLLKDYL
jgi:predicted MPP superfamily phosphohydrolase